MNQVQARIWNEIARTQTLQTPWAREAFKRSESQITEAQEADYLRLKKQGIPPIVASQFLALRPLLLENVAISQYVMQHPAEAQDLRQALPEVTSPREATLLASADYPLNPSQQEQLEQLLAKAQSESQAPPDK